MIRKRGEFGEYHYEFMQSGKRYYGVCEACTTERDALAYEKSIRDTVKKAAAQKTHKALIENFKRELTGGNDVLLASAWELYLSKPARRHPGTLKESINHRRWTDFITFMSEIHPDIVRLDQVLSQHAEEYINHLRTKGRFIREVKFEVKAKKTSKTATYTPSGTLTKQTINDYHRQCKSVFERLKDDAGMIANPFAFEAMAAKRESRDAFSMEELRKIGDSLQGFCRPLFIIGICTGLSLGDVCLLQWRDIRDRWIVRKRRKTGASLEIPMLPPLASFIEEQRRITGTGDYVLPEHATMYRDNRTGVSYRINEFLTGIGIDTTRATGGSRKISVKDFHSLRHTFAYIAGIYQIPLAIVQGILGHMTPEMTKHYQEHATREDKERYMLQLPDFLGSGNIPILPESNFALPGTEPERTKLAEFAQTGDIAKIREYMVLIHQTKENLSDDRKKELQSQALNKAHEMENYTLFWPFKFDSQTISPSVTTDSNDNTEIDEDFSATQLLPPSTAVEWAFFWESVAEERKSCWEGLAQLYAEAEKKVVRHNSKINSNMLAGILHEEYIRRYQGSGGSHSEVCGAILRQYPNAGITKKTMERHWKKHYPDDWENNN